MTSSRVWWVTALLVWCAIPFICVQAQSLRPTSNQPAKIRFCPCSDSSEDENPEVAQLLQKTAHAFRRVGDILLDKVQPQQHSRRASSTLSSGHYPVYGQGISQGPAQSLPLNFYPGHSPVLYYPVTHSGGYQGYGAMQPIQPVQSAHSLHPLQQVLSTPSIHPIHSLQSAHSIQPVQYVVAMPPVSPSGGNLVSLSHEHDSTAQDDTGSGNVAVNLRRGKSSLVSGKSSDIVVEVTLGNLGKVSSGKKQRFDKEQPASLEYESSEEQEAPLERNKIVKILNLSSSSEEKEVGADQTQSIASSSASLEEKTAEDGKEGHTIKLVEAIMLKPETCPLQVETFDKTAQSVEKAIEDTVQIRSQTEETKSSVNGGGETVYTVKTYEQAQPRITREGENIQRKTPIPTAVIEETLGSSGSTAESLAKTQDTEGTGSEEEEEEYEESNEDYELPSSGYVKVKPDWQRFKEENLEKQVAKMEKIFGNQKNTQSGSTSARSGESNLQDDFEFVAKIFGSNAPANTPENRASFGAGVKEASINERENDQDIEEFLSGQEEESETGTTSSEKETAVDQNSIVKTSEAILENPAKGDIVMASQDSDVLLQPGESVLNERAEAQGPRRLDVPNSNGQQISFGHHSHQTGGHSHHSLPHWPQFRPQYHQQHSHQQHGNQHVDQIHHHHQQHNKPRPQQHHGNEHLIRIQEHNQKRPHILLQPTNRLPSNTGHHAPHLPNPTVRPQSTYQLMMPPLYKAPSQSSSHPTVPVNRPPTQASEEECEDESAELSPVPQQPPFHILKQAPAAQIDQTTQHAKSIHNVAHHATKSSHPVYHLSQSNNPQFKHPQVHQQIHCSPAHQHRNLHQVASNGQSSFDSTSSPNQQISYQQSIDLQHALRQQAASHSQSQVNSKNFAKECSPQVGPYQAMIHQKPGPQPSRPIHLLSRPTQEPAGGSQMIQYQSSNFQNGKQQSQPVSHNGDEEGEDEYEYEEEYCEEEAPRQQPNPAQIQVMNRAPQYAVQQGPRQVYTVTKNPTQIVHQNIPTERKPQHVGHQKSHETIYLIPTQPPTPPSKPPHPQNDGETSQEESEETIYVIPSQAATPQPKPSFEITYRTPLTKSVPSQSATHVINSIRESPSSPVISHNAQNNIPKETIYVIQSNPSAPAPQQHISTNSAAKTTHQGVQHVPQDTVYLMPTESPTSEEEYEEVYIYEDAAPDTPSEDGEPESEETANAVPEERYMLPSPQLARKVNRHRMSRRPFVQHHEPVHRIQGQPGIQSIRQVSVPFTYNQSDKRTRTIIPSGATGRTESGNSGNTNGFSTGFQAQAPVPSHRTSSFGAANKWLAAGSPALRIPANGANSRWQSTGNDGSNQAALHRQAHQAQIIHFRQNQKSPIQPMASQTLAQPAVQLKPSYGHVIQTEDSGDEDYEGGDSAEYGGPAAPIMSETPDRLLRDRSQDVDEVGPNDKIAVFRVGSGLTETTPNQVYLSEVPRGSHPQVRFSTPNP